MKENQTLQDHLRQLRQNHHSETQNQILQNSSKEEGQGRSSLFPSHEHHLLLFAYNRQKDESSPGQIMLMEQPKKKHKEEVPMANLQPIQQPPPQEQFFLQKVDPSQQVELTQEIRQMLSISSSLSKQDRFDRRREMFEASKARRFMEVASEEAMAKRTIRVVKLDSLIEGGSVRGVVELGRRQVPYEQLDLGETGPDYYTLIKKKPDPVAQYPRLRIEEEIMKGDVFYYGEDDVMEQKNLEDYDSNSENNSNNDYPDQDMSWGDGDEELIEYDYRNGWDEYDQMEDEGEDEEEVYQRYLRRVGRKEKKRYTEEMYEEQNYY